MSLVLVAAPDGAITRIDRALWMTMPFSLAGAVPASPTALVSLTLKARTPNLTVSTRAATLTLPALSKRR